MLISADINGCPKNTVPMVRMVWCTNKARRPKMKTVSSRREAWVELQQEKLLHLILSAVEKSRIKKKKKKNESWSHNLLQPPLLLHCIIDVLDILAKNPAIAAPCSALSGKLTFPESGFKRLMELWLNTKNSLQTDSPEEERNLRHFVRGIHRRYYVRNDNRDDTGPSWIWNNPDGQSLCTVYLLFYSTKI